MSIAWIITDGLGFTPGNTRYLPTLGYLPSQTTPQIIAGKSKNRARERARVNAMAERYNRVRAPGESAANEVISPIIRRFTRQTAVSDIFSLPEAKGVDFEAMAASDIARKEFITAVRHVAAMRAEEEEFAVMFLASVI